MVGGVVIAFGNGARAVANVQELAWSAEEGVICPRGAAQRLPVPTQRARRHLQGASWAQPSACLWESA